MLFQSSEWIWHNSYCGVNVYVSFEDGFTLGRVPERALFRISCDRNYALYINGEFVNCGQYSDYEDLKFYDELDVTPHLRVGENRLLCVVYYQNESCSTYRHGKPGLIFELADGENMICASSGKTVAYKCSAFADGGDIEKVSGQLGFSFRYDSTREGEREGERPADIVSKTRELRPRPIEKLVIGDPLGARLINTGSFSDTAKSGSAAQRISSARLCAGSIADSRKLPFAEGMKLTAPADSDGIAVIIDLGRETAGFPCLDIELPCKCDVFFAWGEHLADLRVRAYISGRSFAFSYRGHEGRNRFENPFLRCGGRYIQLHIYAAECRLFYAGLRPTCYPLPEPAEFSCADALHNRIYEVSLDTLRLCMHEHYEDCPWREQALYSMDSRNQMLCGYYAFGETRFARASIELMAHSIRSDNMLELCSPAEVSITIPSFSAIFLTQLYEYLDFSGDAEFVERILPTAMRIADEFISREENGLLKCFGGQQYWNFYEWQTGLSGSGSGEIPESERSFDAPLCAFVSMGLRSLSAICARLGRKESAEYYSAHHRALNRAIGAFWDEAKGCYCSFIKDGVKSHYSELTNSLIVCADAASEDKLDRVLAAISGGELLSVTLSHSIFKYDALMRDKRSYARSVFGEIARLWGHMLSKNATSFWETIDGDEAFGNAGSLCHGWSAIPVYVYFKYALNEPGELTGIYEARVGKESAHDARKAEEKQ